METHNIKMPVEFSIDQAASFREEVYPLVKTSGVRVELDFSECTFIDSTGLGVLVGMLKKSNENHCRMILKHLNADVARVFKITRLEQVFDIQ